MTGPLKSPQRPSADAAASSGQASSPASSAGPGLTAAAQAQAQANRAAAAILALDVELRQARSVAEVHYFAANEPRLVTRSQQILVFGPGLRNRLRIEAISAVTAVDRSSPLVVGMEGIVAALGRSDGLDKVREFDAGAFAHASGGLSASYPLTKLIWLPYLDLKGALIGGALHARTTPWTAPEIAIAEHLAGSVSRSLLALRGTSQPWHWTAWFTRRKLAGIALLLLLLMFVPVPMSALAPLEVVPRDPFIVTAGTEGVVETVHVDPNAEVKTGDILVTLEDTVLRNRYEIAEQEVGVAEASLKKAKQLAFVDVRGRHDVATAEAELTVRRAERDYAREMLERSVIRADRSGIVLLESKRDLIGRPVATGEKLMEIVDPSAVLLNIDLPVADAVVLDPGADVTAFLDSDPLHPLPAKLIRSDYRARVHDQQQLAFRLVAEATEGAAGKLRLGVRGTAQVYAGKVSLGLYLFRRPLQAARRWIGL